MDSGDVVVAMATDDRGRGGGGGGGFEETKFMKDLVHLRDTQESIQGLSAWTIRNRKAAYKIARCWLKCIKKGEKLSYSTFP